MFINKAKGEFVMALIKCPECGKEISDRAPSCVNCGCPIQSQNAESKVVIKALKHPNESHVIGYSLGTPMYGRCVTEMMTGQTTSLNIDSDMEIYASFYPIGKKGLFNLGEKTKSNTIHISAGQLTKVQISYIFGNLTKIVINKVDEFDPI